MTTTIFDLKATVHKLARNHQFPVTTRTLRRVLDQYGFTPLHVRRTASGTENETFMVDCQEGAYVLRIYRQHRKLRADMNRELDFMSFLAEHGLPVPRVIEDRKERILSETTIDGVTWQSILMSQMPGEHPRAYSPELFQQMAHLQARLHLMGYKYIRLARSTDVALAANPLTLQRRLAASLRRIIRSGIEHWIPRGIVHFDFTAGNVLYKQRRITAVLDFDDMACTALVNCLATTLVRLPQSLQTPEVITSYIAAYEAVRPLRPVERLYLYTLLAVKRLRLQLSPAAV